MRPIPPLAHSGRVRGPVPAVQVSARNRVNCEDLEAENGLHGVGHDLQHLERAYERFGERGFIISSVGDATEDKVLGQDCGCRVRFEQP